MRKFTPVGRSIISDQGGGTVEPWENLIVLEGRVYQLEKDIELLSSIFGLAAMVGVYFAFRWYQQHVSQIPGVDA